MNMLGSATLALSLAAGISGAVAGASQWEQAEGGALRVVTMAEADAHGRIAGALEIRLKPGWKTYWRDPGDAGVPPQLQFSIEGTPVDSTLRFPAPKRFDDGYAVWAGYDRDVTLPFWIESFAGGMPSLRADVFIGMCDEICVPVQAALDVDLTAADGQAEIQAGLAALPKEARPGFQATLRGIDEEGLDIEVETPPGAGKVELYVASTSGHMLGVPRTLSQTERGSRMRVPVISTPKGGVEAEPFKYTIVTETGAVSGSMTYAPLH